MKKERKVNLIRALKSELEFYKHQPVNINTVYKTNLTHLRINQMFSRQEVLQMPKHILSDLVIDRMTKSFRDSIMDFPIETEFDELLGGYRASLDLWVKPKNF